MILGSMAIIVGLREYEHDWNGIDNVHMTNILVKKDRTTNYDQKVGVRGV